MAPVTATVVAHEAFTVVTPATVVYTPVTFYDHTSWIPGEMYNYGYKGYYSLCIENKYSCDGIRHSRHAFKTDLVKGWISDNGCYYVGSRDNLKLVELELEQQNW